jgi:septal ring factor EnvC (AmiA/AmiB activator)
LLGGETIGGGALTKAQIRTKQKSAQAILRSREEAKEARFAEAQEWSMKKDTESAQKGAAASVEQGDYNHAGDQKGHLKGNLKRRFGINLISVNSSHGMIVGTTSTALFAVWHNGTEGVNGSLLTINGTEGDDGTLLTIG